LALDTLRLTQIGCGAEVQHDWQQRLATAEVRGHLNRVRPAVGVAVLTGLANIVATAIGIETDVSAVGSDECGSREAGILIDQVVV
jgi:hypothetical protein